MLDVLRRGASTWISKLLLGVLIVSFGVWGIADVFRGFGSNVAFQIGSTEIGVAQFDQIYSRELQQVSRRAQRPISKDEALKLGLGQQIISKVVTGATISEAARAGRIDVSDKTIADGIVDDPAFKAANGAFDRNRFVELLRSNGWNEDMYVREKRTEILREQLIEGVSGGITTPKVMLEAYDQYLNEQRSVRFVTLTAATLGEIAPPSDADLATFFAARKAAFRAPETRSFVALLLDAASIAKASDVTDDDAKAEWARQKARFTTPEKRRVRQMSFDDAAAAKAAAEKIAAGTSFADLAAERGLKLEDLDLGLMQKSGFLDPKIGDAAFALAKTGDVSPVVEGRIHPVILQLEELVPATEKPYAEVADELKLEIAKRRAEGDVLARHDQIEDAIAGGAKLTEVASRFGLKPIVVDKMGRDGRMADGKPFTAVPDAQKLISGVWESDVGVENDPLELGGKGFLWYALTAVDPAHDRTLDEVKPAVLAAWTAEETRKRLTQAATAIVDRLKAGEDFAKVAEESKLELTTSAEFKRNETPETLSAAAVAAAFDGPEGSVASVAGKAEGDQIVEQVASVTQPAFFAETDESKTLATKAAGSLQNTLLESWIAQVQKDVGVSTNQTNVARVIGRIKD